MAQTDTQIRISLIDGVTRSLTEIQRGVTGLGASIAKVNQAAELTGRAFGALGAVGEKLAGTISGVADFEQSLATLRAVTGASADEMKRLEDAAISASQRTRFSSTEAAQGLTELARAGLDATDAINVLNPALALAQGNNISVAQSSELLTTTIKQFGASMAEAAVFADTLQATADKTSTSVEQIGLAMSYAAPLARQLGLSVQDTSAIIGALADQGFRGERAGTALRNVFSSLLDPSSKFSEALRDAGIKSTNFAEVIEQLAGKGDKAKEVLLSLDAEARPAILSLVNNGGKAVTELRGKLDDLSGAAQRTADIMGDTFNGAWARLQNTFENTRNALLAPILKPLADEFDSFAKQLQAFTKSEAFAKLVEDIRKFASEGIKAVGDFVRDFDFAEALKNAQEFASDVKVVFEGVSSSIRGVAEALSAVKDESAAPVTTGVGDLASALAKADLSAQGLSDTIGAAAVQGSAFSAAMSSASLEIAGVGEKADASNEKLGSFGDGIEKLAERLAKLAVSSAGFKALSEGVGKFRAEIARVPEPAKLLEGTFTDLESALQSQIGVLRDAQAAYQKAFSAGKGGADEAWQAVKRAGAQVADLRRQIDATKGSAIGLTDAFKELGFQSQAALEAAARKGGEAFDAITAAARRGEAAQQDVIRAFEEYARRLSDTAALSDATTQEQIARQIELRGRIAGVSEELIRASTIGLRAGDDIAVGGKKAADGWKQVSDQAEKTASGFKAAADSAEESSRRTTAAAQQTANALRDQRVVQIELTDGWREQAEAIGVNVGAWDRLVENTQIATDRLLGLSQKRKKQYEEEKQAADSALESTQKLTEQPAASNSVGGLNTGTQRPANTAPTTPTPTATQPAGGAGSITINVSGFVTQDALDQVVNRIQRAGLLAR